MRPGDIKFLVPAKCLKKVFYSLKTKSLHSMLGFGKYAQNLIYIERSIYTPH